MTDPTEETLNGWRCRRDASGAICAVKLLAVLFGLSAASPALACSPTDIKIKQADWQPPSGSGLVRVVGELTNTCDEPIDAQLHFVFRDAAGKVTGVDDEWVSTVNIEPHSDYAFSALPRGGLGFKTMTVTVQDVRRMPGN